MRLSNRGLRQRSSAARRNPGASVIYAAATAPERYLCPPPYTSLTRLSSAADWRHASRRGTGRKHRSNQFADFALAVYDRGARQMLPHERREPAIAYTCFPHYQCYLRLTTGNQFEQYKHHE